MSKISLSTPTNDFCPQTLFLYGTYKEDGTPDFGLFCWFSYYWDTELMVMAAIGGDKLTRDRLHADGVFSANLVTEELLSTADYLGNISGYDENKMKIDLEIGKGTVLDVPVLASSPWTYELEVVQSLPQADGEIFLCRIRNILADEKLLEKGKTVEERIRSIAPVHTTCSTYFGWDGKALGAWGEIQKKN